MEMQRSEMPLWDNLSTTDVDTSVLRLKADTLAKVRAKAEAGCFMCRLLLESLDQENRLRDWPLGADDPLFPVDAQAYHIAKDVITKQASSETEER